MNGIAKLIDFGIAKARDRVSEDTSDRVLKGKVHYMAPEQALGRPVDRRADVWAVGAILHHLLSGRRAFDGENHLATLHLLTSGRPPLPLPPSVHPAVSAIVRRALSQGPERRYATAAEMQGAIEAAMVEAGLVTTTTAVAAFVQRAHGGALEEAEGGAGSRALCRGAARQGRGDAGACGGRFLVRARRASGHRQLGPGRRIHVSDRAPRERPAIAAGVRGVVFVVSDARLGPRVSCAARGARAQGGLARFGRRERGAARSRCGGAGICCPIQR